ncbi:MAG: hypothetical protein ABSC23_07570 [Bryobacteraceae bacterium]|jgi:hypothetical protein
MPTKSSRRLAGCCAIELLFAAGLLAADPEYRAGTAAAGQVKALALEDRRGARAVIAQGEFPVTQQISDFAAAQLMKAYGLERGAILLRWTGVGQAGSLRRVGNPPDGSSASAAASDFMTAIGAALGAMDTARLMSDGASLAVLTTDGRCLAAIRLDASFASVAEPCPSGRPVRSPIRAAFRTVDITQGLQPRNAPFRVYPVQALALGKEFAILGLGGDAPVSDFRAKGLIVAPFSSDDGPYPSDPRVREAIRGALAQVGR